MQAVSPLEQARNNILQEIMDVLDDLRQAHYLRASYRKDAVIKIFRLYTLISVGQFLAPNIETWFSKLQTNTVIARKVNAFNAIYHRVFNRELADTVLIHIADTADEQSYATLEKMHRLAIIQAGIAATASFALLPDEIAVHPQEQLHWRLGAESLFLEGVEHWAELLQKIPPFSGAIVKEIPDEERVWRTEGFGSHLNALERAFRERMPEGMVCALTVQELAARPTRLQTEGMYKRMRFGTRGAVAGASASPFLAKALEAYIFDKEIAWKEAGVFAATLLVLASVGYAVGLMIVWCNMHASLRGSARVGIQSTADAGRSYGTMQRIPSIKKMERTRSFDSIRDADAEDKRSSSARSYSDDGTQMKRVLDDLEVSGVWTPPHAQAADGSGSPIPRRDSSWLLSSGGSLGLSASSLSGGARRSSRSSRLQWEQQAKRRSSLVVVTVESPPPESLTVVRNSSPTSDDANTMPYRRLSSSTASLAASKEGAQAPHVEEDHGSLSS